MAVAALVPEVITDQPVLEGRVDAYKADHARLVRYVEEAEQATRIARQKAERDRDYYDGKQLTEDEHRALVLRGQPPIAFNVIRSRVDYLQGLEKQQRRDPRAWPRNPQDQPAADAFTDGLRYAAEEADYQTARSGAWSNILVEGYGGVELSANPDNPEDFDVTRIPWDRIIYDPHSIKPDFSDARYLGQVLWLDEDDAVERAVKNGVDEAAARLIFENTIGRGTSLTDDTYEDKPKDIWASRDRKRIRLVALWHQERGDWRWSEFTKAGMLGEGVSPYRTKDGESVCTLILESAYIDRDNNRYGIVRDLIDPQDEINKRRSKALWLVTTRGVIAEEGAVPDKEKARRELARPDFYIEKAPQSEFQLVQSGDLASGQSQLGQQALEYVLTSGANNALQGRVSPDQSGRAIEAQQQGGLVELGDLLDTLRRLDRRVFRMLAVFMQQFWRSEKWIRITDDELNPQHVGLNEPLVRAQQVMGPDGQPQEVPVLDPYTGQPIVEGIKNNVAELDVDIIVTDAPDVISLDGETYTAFTQLLSSGLPPPMMRLAIELHPGLTAKRKKQALDMLEQMSQADPMAAEQAKMEMAEKSARIEEMGARGFLAMAKGEEIARRAQTPAFMPEQIPA